VLDTFLPQRNGIADAFDYVGTPRSIEAKYGDAAGDVKELYDEVAALIAASERAGKVKVGA
jgi:hypothetical protein